MCIGTWYTSTQHRTRVRNVQEVLHLDHQLGPHTSLGRREQTRQTMLAGAWGGKSQWRAWARCGKAWCSCILDGCTYQAYIEVPGGIKRVSYIFRHALRPPPSVGRPCRTTTERQGVVDGAFMGPANDARDGSAAQTPAGVAYILYLYLAYIGEDFCFPFSPTTFFQEATFVTRGPSPIDHAGDRRLR